MVFRGVGHAIDVGSTSFLVWSAIFLYKQFFQVFI